MKCRKCGGKAVINLPQHNLGLCKDDYLEWLPEQMERSIKKYSMFTRDERILVAVSGGKDSLSLWDILQRLGYKADGFYVGLGIDEGTAYSDTSRALTEAFANERGLTLHQVEISSEIGKNIPTLAFSSVRGREKPCSVCGLVKRYQMNRFACLNGYTVLATGHNLDDETSVLFGNTMIWAGEYLQRQAPVLPESTGMVRKVKPLVRFSEREMAAYAMLRGIEYIYIECPFAVDAPSIYYKNVLNQLENHHPGRKLIFYLNFLKAHRDGLFKERGEKVNELFSCVQCGGPASAPGSCSYCRLISGIAS